MIKVFRKLEYDPEKALQWANTNMPLIIKHSIDKKIFDNFAKANPLKFVEIIEEYKPCLPKEFKDV